MKSHYTPGNPIHLALLATMLDELRRAYDEPEAKMKREQAHGAGRMACAIGLITHDAWIDYENECDLAHSTRFIELNAGR